MARTWVETPGKLRRISRIDGVGRHLVRAATRAYSESEDPKSILVVELWQLGDVVLATAALAALRKRFPRARITLLAKPHARELLANSGLVDEIVTFEFPWTAFSGKYLPWRYRPLQLTRLFRRLRRANFDLSVDCRMDLRSNLVTYLSGARRRIGYDFGGGSFLLTDALPAEPDAHHKVVDWLNLLAPLGISAEDFAPKLSVSADERENAKRTLVEMGLLSKPLVVIHPGARQEVRRWNPLHFAEVARHIVASHRADVLVIADENGYGRELGASVPGVRVFSGNIREMMAVMTHAALVIANDSGPMHVAAALGAPVIAVFGPQRKEWYGPFGEKHRVVWQETMPCRPCFDSCIFAEPICMTGVTPAHVIDAVDEWFETAPISLPG